MNAVLFMRHTRLSQQELEAKIWDEIKELDRIDDYATKRRRVLCQMQDDLAAIHDGEMTWEAFQGKFGKLAGEG